ncbi:DUF5995 family protein [Flavobacterium amniphilum]|uniref:DUF5995 family protein n=1 Tax=Flavobacterium amniphilum TaxID=1834035 RepID=UPI00202AB2E5|nr:DUF5995 family protein [Flavobacterium amniphilum]MCL9805772.1 DUF5995 family protein [Flavobacterium amniphilum]MCL9806359.1 DUF5995 family protein [Flavobacterium amniphilum]
MQATNIDEVIEILNTIVEECKANNNPLGYFAVLYRKVTIRVKEGILNNRFEDNARMEKLDVRFANRYFKAYFDDKNNTPISKSWKISFKAITKKHLVLQHLLTGINAHINLDLSIATVDTVENNPLDTIKSDFNHINSLLSELTDDVKQNMGSVSPIFKLLMPLAKQWDDKLIEFSIQTARDGAWLFANDLNSNPDKREILIKERDAKIETLGFKLLNPVRTLQWVLNMILFFEGGSVKDKIETLEGKLQTEPAWV